MRANETARQRDDETTRQQDHETTGQRDDGTTRLQKNAGIARNIPWSRSPEVPQKTQAFSGVLSLSQSFSVFLSCAWLCVAVRGCARQLGVRVVQMWCQVEVWLDGGVLGVHPHSDERAWCRRCAAITTRAWWEKGCRCVLSQKRVPWDSTKTYSPRHSTFWDGTQMRPYAAKRIL